MDYYLFLAKIFDLLHTEDAVVFQNTDFLILLFCQNDLISWNVLAITFLFII